MRKTILVMTLLGIVLLTGCVQKTNNEISDREGIFILIETNDADSYEEGHHTYIKSVNSKKKGREIQVPQNFPMDCKVWYDGCNMIKMEDARVVSFTERHCHSKHMVHAKCIKTKSGMIG